MTTPPVIVIDYETALLDGTPSVDYYRDDFRVISMAAAWRDESGEIETHYAVGEHEAMVFLKRAALAGQSLVVHNYQFEFGVTLHRLPGLEGCIDRDTMRLVQVADNGGSWAAWQPKLVTEESQLDDGEVPASSGLSLMAAASRWLPPEWRNHKEPFHAWLRERGVKKGQEGANLTKLPPEMLEAYNVADAKVTLLLYETLIEALAKEGYDWKLDHELYKSTARMVASAKGTGARVERGALARYVIQIEGEVAEIEAEFRAKYRQQIENIEQAAHIGYAKALITPKGQERRLAEEPERFNLGSNKQLRQLFVDTLGITPKFWTKAPKGRKADAKEFVPSPSFKAAHLSTYGKGGEILIKRRKRLLVLQQARSLLKLADYDGRWHMDLRACGTATGRMAGGRIE